MVVIWAMEPLTLSPRRCFVLLKIENIDIHFFCLQLAFRRYEGRKGGVKLYAGRTARQICSSSWRLVHLQNSGFQFYYTFRNCSRSPSSFFRRLLVAGTNGAFSLTLENPTFVISNNSSRGMLPLVCWLPAAIPRQIIIFLRHMGVQPEG